MIEVRLMGLPADVEQAAHVLATAFDVLERRGPYMNRGDSQLVRSYLKVAPRAAGPVQARAVRTDRPEIEIDAPRQIGYAPRRRRRI